MWGLALLASVSFPQPSLQDRVLRDDFETPKVAWVEEGGDLARPVKVHERTISSAHTGKQSEHIGVSAQRGTYLYYGYPVRRAPVVEDLRISLWVKANRPGIQLLARVVFPHQRDRDSNKPVTALIAGGQYNQSGTWQRLDLPQPVLAMQRQARLLRAALAQDINVKEAYVDRVILNVFGGPGITNVFLDGLEVSPVLGNPTHSPSAQLGLPLEDITPPVEINQEKLLLRGQPVLLRAIRAPGVPPNLLKEYGFNVLAIEWPLDLDRIERAVRTGFWLQPQLPGLTGQSPKPLHELRQMAGEFPLQESVLSWHLGPNLDLGQFSKATKLFAELRDAPLRRPVSGDVTGHFWAYSRQLDMISVRRWPIGTAMGLRGYRDWLFTQRFLARPGSYFFTWVQAFAKEIDTADGRIDAGPAPEQIRLMTYAALAAGYRGVGFWADATLGQPGMGQQRLLEMGLLNLELQLLEPYLASPRSKETVRGEFVPPETGSRRTGKRYGRPRGPRRTPLEPSRPAKPAPNRIEADQVQATVVRSDRAQLVIPVWFGSNGQFVAGQFAGNNLRLVIPGAPEAAQAWLLTPATIQRIGRMRIAGGTQLHLPMLDLTSMIVLTSDMEEVKKLRDAVARSSPSAADWSVKLARSKLQHVQAITGKLANLGKGQPGNAELIRTAGQYVTQGQRKLEQNDYETAYLAAQKALRALRIVQQSHWNHAVAQLSCPQASPYAVSFASLPEHWRFLRELAGADYSDNLLATGSFDFEDPKPILEEWYLEADPTGTLELRAMLSSRDPQQGSRSLHLRSRPVDGKELPAMISNPMPALVSKPVTVERGDVLRIGFWLRVPSTIQGNLDGVVIYDSIAGRALAVTRYRPQEWKRFTLYRRVHETGRVAITLGLAGVGDAFIDDLQVQRLVQGPSLARQKGTPKSKRK